MNGVDGAGLSEGAAKAMQGLAHGLFAMPAGELDATRRDDRIGQDWHAEAVRNA